MCRICVSLGLVRSIPESRFLVLFLASMFSLNPIFELLLGRGNTKVVSVTRLMAFRFQQKSWSGCNVAVRGLTCQCFGVLSSNQICLNATTR